MILVSTPIKRDWMKEFVSELVFEDQKYQFVKEEAMKLFFDIDVEDQDAAAKFLKDSVKQTDVGSVLYFSSKAV